MTVRKHTAVSSRHRKKGGAEAPDITKGVERARLVYQARMWAFSYLIENRPKAKRREEFRDYTTKNCEEAWAGRRGNRTEEKNGLG